MPKLRQNKERRNEIYGKVIRMLLFRCLEVLRNANNEILLDVTKNPGSFAKQGAQTFNDLPIIQWTLYKADTIRSKKKARFMEMSAL